jgi:signal transduction histidine kinase
MNHDANARIPVTPPGIRPWVYGLGPLAVALLLRLLLEPLLADKSPFLLFTVAVMAGTAYGGALVGLVATTVGAVAGLYFLAEDAALHSAWGPHQSAQVALYLLCCGTITAFLEVRRRYRLRTERLAAERSRLAEDLARANRLKDEFLATVSHELRTPMNAIVGWSGLMLSGSLPPARLHRAAEVIQRSARIQEQLIADLLDVSRITAGKVRLQPRVVTARDIAVAATDTVRPAAHAKHVDLVVHAESGSLVWADPDRLHQAVWNLLSNAVKFTPPQGQVVTSVEADARETRIRVEDTGPGIRPEFLAHVFDRFRQDDSAKGHAAGGLGLGLAIVKHLVELHGGTVAAANRAAGPGAAFTIVLPRYYPPSRLPARGKAAVH